MVVHRIQAFYYWIVLYLFYSISLDHLTSAGCPKPEYLVPNCWCVEFQSKGTLWCKDVFDAEELYGPVGACINYQMTGFSLVNSTLRFMPHDLFEKTNFQKIELFNTGLMSLSETDLAFEGLENHIEEIKAHATDFVAQWDFTQLRNLKKLQTIHIRHMEFEAISENLPELTALTSFTLQYAKLSLINDFMFSKCPKLSELYLNDNHLTHLKRSMLPYPAQRLHQINLNKNQLTTLPSDFFDDMPALKIVQLNVNRFTTVDAKIFSDIMGHIYSVEISGNPLNCDCQLNWLMKRRLNKWMHAECEEPPKLKGRRLYDIDSGDLQCDK